MVDVTLTDQQRVLKPENLNLTDDMVNNWEVRLMLIIRKFW
jgi:hypothetical protein